MYLWNESFRNKEWETNLIEEADIYELGRHRIIIKKVVIFQKNTCYVD